MPKVAVVGTGHWGKNHARVYKGLLSEGIIDDLVICDSDGQRAEQLGGELDVRYTSGYEELLHDASVQAVNIVTPSKTHYEIGEQFLRAGKDVLIEKPMTMDINQAKRLVEIATESGRILMVGHIFRYHAAVQELRRMIDAGELGTIQNIMGTRLHYGLPRKDMGVIYALGIHELDLFCHLLCVEYPVSLIAAESRAYQQDTEETAVIAMDFGYAKGYAFESWLVATYGKIRDLVVVGSNGSARVDFLSPQELYIFDNRVVEEEGIPVAIDDRGKRKISLPYSEPLTEELKHFISCTISRQTPLSDGIVGLRAVVMAEAALRSARTGQAVMLSSML